MSEFAIEVEGGKSVRLKTAGKYCDRNIVVTATGGGGGDTDAAYEQGVADGKQAEHDRFWDAYQSNGARRNYKAAFNGQYWSDKNFDPKHDLIVTNANSMFQESLITGHEKILSADFSKCVDFALAFRASAIEELGVIDLASSGSNMGQFLQSAKVKKIAKIKVYENNTFSSTSFSGAASLTDLTFDGVNAKGLNLQWSPLSVESMKSIILCLKDYSGTDKEYTYTVKFSDECWDALLNDGTVAPNGMGWDDYIDNIGWLY